MHLEFRWKICDNDMIRSAIQNYVIDVHVFVTLYISISIDFMYALYQGSGGITVKKTSQALIIGIYDEPLTPGQCNMIVERLGDYLIEQGLWLLWYVDDFSISSKFSGFFFSGRGRLRQLSWPCFCFLGTVTISLKLWRTRCENKVVAAWNAVDVCVTHLSLPSGLPLWMIVSWFYNYNFAGVVSILFPCSACNWSCLLPDTMNEWLCSSFVLSEIRLGWKTWSTLLSLLFHCLAEYV